MDRYMEAFRWAVLLGVTAVVVWLSVSRNTFFALGVLAGVAAGSHRTAYRHLSGEAVSTAVATLSAGLFVAAVSVTAVSIQWLPTLSTAALGYAIGIIAAWLLVSGTSVEGLGPFAAIGGLLVAVFGGAGGLLIVPDATLFAVMLFGGLVGGGVVTASGFAASALSTPSTRRSTDSNRLKPATRFRIEAAAITVVAVGVPFGSRAVVLFGFGGAGWFPVGLLGGVMLSVSLWAVGDNESTRLRRLHNWVIEQAYRLLDWLDRWVERRRRTHGSRRGLEASTDETDGSERLAATAEEPGKTSKLLDQAAARLADHEFVRMAAEELDSLSATSNLQSRVALFWSRLGGAVERHRPTTGATLQLSAAEAAHREGDSDRARSLTDTALQLAAPTIGAVAAAVVRGRRSPVETVLDGLAPLFGRLDHLLADEPLAAELDDPDQLGLIQRLLERVIDEETGEGFDSALSTIRAAAADGWYSVLAGDQALSDDDHQRALVAYLSAIRAYRRAYDIATEAKQMATAERKAPEVDSLSTDGDHQLRATASTYAAEATRIETALEALLYDTAGITIAAIDDLYGVEPPPTVDTDDRRTIVRTLRVLRQTQARIDATVPPIGLADDRYQHAEIARSVARIRRHLADADDTARRGNISAAVEQYARVADRLDMLSNRAGTAGLSELARSLVSAATTIGRLAENPTAEAITERPDPTVPTPEDRRAPEAVAASRRLRRTFCEPAFVELWAFTDEVADHPILTVAGEPFPELVEAVSMSLGSLDPLYTAPDVESLQAWVAETTLDVLSAALETVAKTQQSLCSMEPRAPPAFREPPTVLKNDQVTTVSTDQGVDTFVDGWLERADALATAAETISRQQAAVDGFDALEAKIRQRLVDCGWLGTSQVTPELLVVAAYHLEGTSYDPDRQRLSKTGDISRRSHESSTEPTELPGETQEGKTDSADRAVDSDSSV